MSLEEPRNLTQQLMGRNVPPYRVVEAYRNVEAYLTVGAYHTVEAYRTAGAYHSVN